MKPSLLRLAALAVLSLSVHCSSTGEAIDTDEGATTSKTPIYENSPYFWAQTDYPTFRQVAQAAPFRIGEPLAENDPLTMRLQAWADRIHDEVARDVHRKTGKDLVAPRPILKIVPAKEANGWVSGIPACFTADADLSALGTHGRPAKTAKLAFVSFDGVKEALSFFGAAPPKCAQPTNWRSQDEAITFFNASGSKCKLARVGDHVTVRGEGCKLEGSDAPTAAKQLTYYAASPYVHFTTAMIALGKDEHALVGILAHELGHYYRAHVVSDVVMGKYNYWYEQKNPPEAIVPPPSGDSVALEERFHRVSPYARPKVPGQKISYRLTSFVVDDLGPLLVAANDKTFGCANAVTKLEGDWTGDFNGFGASYVTKSTMESYLAYESALLACAARVPVSAGGGGALKLTEVRDAAQAGATEFATPAVASGTLADVLKTLQDRASVLDREEAELMSSLESRRLGRWTAEQEADDFSLEYYSRVGLTPSTRIETYLDLIKAHVEIDAERFAGRNGGLDLPTCEAMYRADWMKTSAGGQKELVFVPLGDLHDPHHGDCYRLFNMSQEQRAHRFRKSGASPSFAEPWESIQAAAKRATDAFKPSGGGGGAHTPLPGKALPPGGTIVDGL